MTLLSAVRRVCVGAAFFLLPATAGAAGFYLTDAGVRPHGRGGAFVAGADDLQSMWYNPAGLSEAGTQLLVDAAYLQYNSSFTRVSLPVASSTNQPQPITFPTVTGGNNFLPLPTLGVSSNFGLKTWTFAFGLHVPYVALPEYKATIDNGTTVPAAAPQRYSLISGDGTALVEAGIYVSKTFFDEKLSIGIGPQLLIGQISTLLALSNCPPGSVICQEQDPNFDALTQVNAGIVVAPTAAFGAIYHITPMWRVGFSGQLPYWIDSGAKLTIQLPASNLFDSATVTGNKAELKMQLPAILRLGVEARPINGLRVEFAVVYEGWSIHNNIQLLADRKNPVQLHGVTGFPDPYAVGDISLPANYHDTANLRLGGEYFGGTKNFGYVLRAGAQYQISAIPDAYKSVYDIDPDRFIGSLGVGLRISGFSIDVSYAHDFAASVNVDPAKAALTPADPVRANGTPATAVNGGHYTENANIIGIAVGYKF